MEERKSRGFVSLIIWYIPVVCVQFVSSVFTVGGMNPWYGELKKASWTPPGWVFAPVWSILYIMMAIAVWRIYRTEPKKKLHFIAYILFFIQLFFNGLWSFLFFKFHLIGWALIDLALLIVLIGATIRYFFDINKLAALLLVPYFVWCLYALTLNAAIWWLN